MRRQRPPLPTILFDIIDGKLKCTHQLTPIDESSLLLPLKKRISYIFRFHSCSFKFVSDLLTYLLILV